jgi:Flp pilus assembly protein TadB
MAKKKAKKKSVKKTTKSNKPVRRKSPVSKSKRSSNVSQGMTRAGWTFVNLLLFITFLYGIWITWDSSWSEGLSIIVAVLLAIFLIRLFLKLKRKK